MTMHTMTTQRGFTLIELAVVLVIIGVLVGSFLGTLGSRIETTRRADTAAELEHIKLGLLGYAYSNNALPCPDCRDAGACGIAAAAANDGVEDRNGAGACAIAGATGNLPWVTIGMGSADAWGNRFNYWVDTNFANTLNPFTLADAAPNGQKIQRRSSDGSLLEDLVQRTVAVVVSHGGNGLGAISTEGAARAAIPLANVDELENADNDDDFISRPPTAEGATSAGGPYDDIIGWLAEYELKARMIDAGVLP
jgi:prepilin-type N-terminal cleavage/methylation domain-containing protein